MTTSSRPTVCCQALSTDMPIDPRANSLGCIRLLSISAGIPLKYSQLLAKFGSLGGQSLGSVPTVPGQHDPAGWGATAGAAATARKQQAIIGRANRAQVGMGGRSWRHEAPPGM